MLQYRVALDCEEFAVRSNWGDWLTAWHPVGYVGLMDEVSIFRRALTAKEIEHLSKGEL